MASGVDREVSRKMKEIARERKIPIGQAMKVLFSEDRYLESRYREAHRSKAMLADHQAASNAVRFIESSVGFVE